MQRVVERIHHLNAGADGDQCFLHHFYVAFLGHFAAGAEHFVADVLKRIVWTEDAEWFEALFVRIVLELS